MGLASALNTALTGLTAAETTIDVVGNNLANANTAGFKASQAAFATQFLQTQSLGSAPTATSGGSDPRQIGLGTMVADIAPNFSQGTIEISSNPTDLAIQGDGFFIVQGGSGEQLYTRNGIFKMNAENQLVTVTGNRLLGFGVDDQFQIEQTTLQSLTIPLGSAAVAQPTANVYLEGTLTPTGDLADTAEIISTAVLGDAQYSYPPQGTAADVALPATTQGVARSSVVSATGGLHDGESYYYRIVYADSPKGADPDTEGTTSSQATAVAATVVDSGAGENAIQLSALPNNSDYSYVRIYRTLQGASSNSTYYYVGEAAVGAGTFVDGKADADLDPLDTLRSDTINGNYSYYVTYAQVGGIESRPSKVIGPVNVVDSRIHLTGLPTISDDDPAEWDVRRVYRNLSTDDSSFYLVAEISDNTVTALTDDVADSVISDPTRPGYRELDFDGPKITHGTLLKDVRTRDGDNYSQVFQPGTLSFTGRKGGRALDAKEMTITEASTVLDLVNFMEQALGIQKVPGLDPNHPIPVDAGSGSPPGGSVTSDGKIRFVANNGRDNAIEIGLSGMQLTTTTGTDSAGLAFNPVQAAKGESAVTDFVVYDSLGIPLSVRLTTVLESRDSSSTTYRWFADSPENDPASGVGIAVGSGLITFDGEGNLVSATDQTVSIERRHVSSASPLEFELDFSHISGLAAESSTLAVSRQDGSGPGVLTSFIIGEDGRIRGVFSNGITRDLGQIRLARFGNAAGLEQRGENLYTAGVNSGLPVQGDPGQQGIGSIIAGATELSNTDVGGNLIDLILASTMYRGNTRVITTIQQMLDELLSLRR